MSDFSLYFGLGKDHILDYANGYDHILFVVALCALYVSHDWKRVLILVTAFTIGHSITLALSTFKIVNVRSELVEFLIPVTIFITAVSNLFKNENNIGTKPMQANYFYALFFGLIHGLGFSNYLRAILGRDKTIITQLFAFNVGLEFGQLVIVLLFMSVCFILVDLFGVDRRDWKMVISSAIAGMALILMKETAFWLDK
ncbi:HupE/UreJ family protein [Chryseolinea sp. T2]|uniref:HupE/UreJ family protein n=1 Tax=Chryseolinea sp. T2 TaxID=3129255 RepID=UPI00307796C1